MALLGARDLTLGYGADAPILDGISFHVDPGERVALVGRNGCGKSTLMKILAGELQPDGGEVITSPGTRITRLVQEVPQDIEGEVFDIVASGLADLGALLSDYHHLSHNLHGDADLARLATLQERMDAAGAWQHEQRVETAISKLQLDAPPHGSDARFETLSGGLKRRALLARALVAEPDLLLLDEPTNHFDIPAIEWLEELLLGYPGTLIFVTHDRAFLRRLATRILELDRGHLRDWPGDYTRYLERKAHELEVEAEQNARFDKKLAQEETWIRQGIKARRTRNEGRVRALERLREQRRQRRELAGSARLRLDDQERSGKKVIEVEGLSFAYDTDANAKATAPDFLIRDLTTTIARGDKVGILGPNGSGKSTLLKLLLGKLTPTAGHVKHGTKLEIAVFDQHREQLDEEATVADNVAGGNDKVTVGGKTRHVISYLSDFLFPPAQTRSPVKSLSGGERNRLLLARLFTRPCNLLVMDEPTNDLDVETLELLESLLVEFQGTLLLVSHDRDFLDNVVTSTLVMEGNGKVGDYAGGYEDWLAQRPKPEAGTTTKGTPAKGKRASKQDPSRPETANGSRPRNLSYREKQELEALPAHIEALEAEQEELHATLADPTLYRDGDGGKVVEVKARLEAAACELATAYERWTELEAIAEASS